MNTLVVSPSLASLEADFLERIGQTRLGDPLAPVTVIVGSNIQHIHLRRRLARACGGVANVRFLTFLDLAGELVLARDDVALRPLPDGSEVLLVRSAARGLDDGSALMLDVSGAAEAIAATIRDLREGGMAPAEVARAGASDKRRALAAIYRAVEERRSGFVDRTRLLEEAAAAPADAFSAVLPDGPVFVYGIYDMNALQTKIVATAATVRDITMFVPWSDSAGTFRFAAPTIERLAEIGFAVTRIDGADVPRAETVIFSASDRQAQAEEIARMVLADVEEGVPVCEIAVLHRLDQRYDEVLAGVFERAGLPYYLPAGRPVRRTAHGRAALNLLAVVCAEPRRGPLLELLSLPCTRLDWVDAELRPHPAAWEVLSKELGLLRGWDEFRSLLALHLGSLSDDHEGSRRLAQSFLDVVEALRARAAQVAGATTWSECAGRFVELFETLVDTAQDETASAAIADRVRQLGILDEFGLPFDVTLFGQAADQALRRVTLSGGYFQRDGLFLGNVIAARGARFRRVYLAECAERVFPPVIREDPMLLDAERAEINGGRSDGWLPLKRARLDEERLLFELACQSAEERLVLSYSRRANLSGTPRLPSSLLLQEAERLSGAFKSIEDLEREPPAWFRRLPSRIAFQGKDGDDALRALDASDLRFHVLEQGGPNANTKIRALWPEYDRLYQLHRERRRERFGRFDGIVPAELVEQAGVLGAQQSPTTLAAYAVCPYRFFLQKALGLRALEEPEQTIEIAPTVRGELVHRILERLVQRYLAEGGDWAAFLARREALVAELLDEEFARLPEGMVGLPVVRAITRDVVAKEIRAYLEREQEAAAEGWRPVAAERSFEGVEVATRLARTICSVAARTTTSGRTSKQALMNRRVTKKSSSASCRSARAAPLRNRDQ